MHGVKIPGYLSKVKKEWPMLAAKFGWSEALTDPLFESSDNTIDHSLSIEASDTTVGWLNLVPNHSWIGYLKGSLALLTSTNHMSTDATYATTTPRKPGDVKVHYGLIASGNRVIKDAEFRK